MTLLVIGIVLGVGITRIRFSTLPWRCKLGRHYIGYYKSRPNEIKLCLCCGKVWNHV